MREPDRGRLAGKEVIMEELKNENVTEQEVLEEPVIEQRPSTKYGRTAYQQQLKEEQAQVEQEAVQSNEYQQNQSTYNQPQQNAYSIYEEAKPTVKDIYTYLIMVLVVLSTIVTFIINVILSEAYSMGNTLQEVVDATIAISQEPKVLLLSTASDVLFWLTVVFLVLDIMQLSRAGKKIGGAIVFAIFLRPAYFIWRAHLLGNKKTVPIIYAILVYMITFTQYYVLLSASMEMVMRTMY